MEIQIIISEDNIEIAKAEAKDFNEAFAELGRLERYFEKKEQELADRLEENN